MLVIPRGTTSELPLIGITNPVSWNSQLVGNFDLISESLGITNLWNFQQKHRMRTWLWAKVWVGCYCVLGYELMAYGLGFGLLYGLVCILGYDLGNGLWCGLGLGYWLQYGLGLVTI